MNLDHSKPVKTHIRLILPKSWLGELDAIADSRFISRLALIRHYLRLHLDKDLENLREQLSLIKDNQRTVSDFNCYRDTRSFKE